MKIFKRIISSASALALCSVMCFSAIQPAVVSATDDTGDDWLHVEGNKVCDAQGNEVWMTGCNWFGYNVGSQVFDGVWSQNMHEMLNQIADHGFNLLRVPMSTELLLQWKNNEPDPMIKVNTYANPELAVDGTEGGDPMYSFDIWNYAVKWCKENGIKIMMDVHCAETASAGHQVNLWYTDKFSTEDWFEGLEWFADYYKDDDTIIAIDLKNEPHGTADTSATMAKWDDTTDANNWKYAAECAASHVLSANPNLLIMVEGTEVYPKFEEGNDWTCPNLDYSRYPYSYYHHTWWGGNFRGARDYPVDLGEYQDKLVYSPHDYGPLVYAQTWFEGDFTKETLLEDCWYDNWFYLYDEKIAPLLIGEWGGFIDAEHDTDGKNKEWMTYLRELIVDNHLHHTFWCFNENSGDTGGLVYDNFSTWDEDKYAFVEPSLWQNESGKFISLDHQIPLGKNGITVSEYYNSEIPVIKAVSGDVTGDGIVDVRDMTAMVQYILNIKSLSASNLKNADMDENGSVNVSDAICLKKYLLNI